MPCIYKITNRINDKVYIGKTLYTLEARWKDHLSSLSREIVGDRPLYSAMKKYGIENFSIEELESCNIDNINEKEVFWIEYYGSFKYGYNATLGGDGKRYCDYELIFGLFQQGLNNKEIQQITSYAGGTITTALTCHNITSEIRRSRGRQTVRKSVAKIDIVTDKILGVYSSIQEAYDNLEKAHSGHIAAVCQGKRKTAYGFKWQYI